MAPDFGWVLRSKALAANFLSTSPAPEPIPTTTPTESPVVIPADLKDSDVLTWDCETTEYKPETIMLTCADENFVAGEFVTAVRLRLGFGAQQSQISAAMRFGQAPSHSDRVRDFVFEQEKVRHQQLLHELHVLRQVL